MSGRAIIWTKHWREFHDLSRLQAWKFDSRSNCPLAPADLVETGDAGGYEAKLCYLTGAERVRFLSGEMGGPNHQLLGFAVSRADDSTQCTKLPAGRLPSPLALPIA